MFAPVSELETEWKRHPDSVVGLRLHIQFTRKPELPLRPALVIALEVTPNLFAVNFAVAEVFHTISKEPEFRIHIGIQAGEYKCGDVIAQPLPAQHDSRPV